MSGFLIVSAIYSLHSWLDGLTNVAIDAKAFFGLNATEMFFSVIIASLCCLEFVQHSGLFDCQLHRKQCVPSINLILFVSSS
jgi:hypothetical protein